MKTAADVSCPRCGAKPGFGCVSRTHNGTWGARTHAGRWKAVGIDKPSPQDLHRNWKTMHENILKVYGDLWKGVKL